MATNVVQRIEKGLIEERQNLTSWLESAPPAELEVNLASPDTQIAQEHLHVIDNALGKAAEGTLGICEVCHQAVETRLLEMDYTACVCLDHFSEQERRRLEAELEFSQAVQKALMPQSAPVTPAFDLAVYSRPAQYVNGDYFDIFSFGDGAQGFAIADAVGHGVSAGLIMSSVQTALRILVPENDGPTAVLERLNRVFLHNANFPTFVTVFLGYYDPATRSLTYCNAGHPPALVYHKQERNILHMPPTGAAIGLLEEFNLEAQSLQLQPEDILLLYTDGLTEAINSQGEEFGVERLAELLTENADSSATELVRATRQELENFLDGQPPEDDTTFIAIKFQ